MAIPRPSNKDPPSFPGESPSLALEASARRPLLNVRPAANPHFA